MGKNFPFSGLVVFLILNAATAGAKGLGVNISLPERGGSFVDMAKEHHRWLNPSDWSALGEEYFDERGWPITDALFLMDMRPVAEWAGEIDDPEIYRIDYSGTYKCSFTGNANVQSSGTGTVAEVIYHPDENRTTFDFVVDEPEEDNYGFFAIVFRNTELEPGGDSGIADLKIIRPGYEEDTEQTFLDEFIYALTNPQFAALRFKDFLGTDGADPVYPGVFEWTDRKLVTDAAQVHIPEIGKNTGAAWEYVVELANEVEIDPWINIPVSATTEYVTEVAKMFKRDLNPDLNVYVESSNEVWNTAPGYEQTQYNKAQAEALGIGERENHARRTVELAQIFESVYGEGSLNDKIRVVLCSHAPMLKWWVQGMLDYIAENFGDVNRYIFAIGRQTF